MGQVNHVIVAVANAELAAAALFREHGLASMPGGRHPGIGTEAWELLSVYNEQEAQSNSAGKAVLKAVDSGQHLLTWCMLESREAAEAAAKRLGPARHMSRALPEGGSLTCTVVGLQQALEDPPLPFFIAWDDELQRPSNVEVEHTAAPVGIAWLELAGRECRLQEHVDRPLPPLQWVEPGPSVRQGIHAIVVAMEEAGPLRLTNESFHALSETAYADRTQDVNKPGALQTALEAVENAVESVAGSLEQAVDKVLPG